MRATADALSADETAPGCYVINVNDVPLPMYQALSTESGQVNESAPLMAAVTARFIWPRGVPESEAAVWLQVEYDQDGETIFGWVRVPDGVAEEEIYDGPRCP